MLVWIIELEAKWLLIEKKCSLREIEKKKKKIGK